MSGSLVHIAHENHRCLIEYLSRCIQTGKKARRPDALPSFREIKERVFPKENPRSLEELKVWRSLMGELTADLCILVDSSDEHIKVPYAGDRVFRVLSRWERYLAPVEEELVPGVYVTRDAYSPVDNFRFDRKGLSDEITTGIFKTVNGSKQQEWRKPMVRLMSDHEDTYLVDFAEKMVTFHRGCTLLFVCEGTFTMGPLVTDADAVYRLGDAYHIPMKAKVRIDASVFETHWIRADYDEIVCILDGAYSVKG